FCTPLILHATSHIKRKKKEENKLLHRITMKASKSSTLFISRGDDWDSWRGHTSITVSTAEPGSNSKMLAIIVVGSVLAGEPSLMSIISTGQESHEIRHIYKRYVQVNILSVTVSYIY
ncbi:hypothetical protein M8C21_015082, partial [Ambrosia artemisiifolia]